MDYRVPFEAVAQTPIRIIWDSYRSVHDYWTGRFGDGLNHIRLPCDGAHQAGVGGIGGVEMGHRRDQGLEIVILLVPRPGRVVGCAAGDQPREIPAGVFEGVVVGEFEVFDDRLAVDDLVCGYRTALRVAVGFLDAEVVRVADRLCAPGRFNGPLGNHQLGWAAGFSFQLDANARDFLQPLIDVFHTIPFLFQ